uniref:Innexin n=1 Tax=Rhabditophanes sp. KR3021 TaxID=114890 RepID=A0AC35THM7_9BILA
MDILIKFVKELTNKNYEDDFADRLNYSLTPLLLLFMAGVNIAKVYLGTALNCFSKVEFKDRWNEYMHAYCLIENTYFVRTNESIPIEYDMRNERQIAYYQWVPYILMIQAATFWFPQQIWRSTNWLTGFRINETALAAKEFIGGSETQKQEIVQLAKSLDLITDIRHKYWRYMNANTYVTLSYFIMKFFNTFLVLIHMKIYQVFIGDHFFSYYAIKHNLEWTNSGLFPRVTVCDFSINKIGQQVNYTVQCVLSSNLLNEKIFIIMWSWMLILLVINIANIINWIWELMNRQKFYESLFELFRDKKSYCLNLSAKGYDNHIIGQESEKQKLLVHSPISKERKQTEEQRVNSTLYNNTDLFIVFKLLKVHAGIYATSKLFQYWCDHQKPLLLDIEPLKIDNDDNISSQALTSSVPLTPTSP